MLSGYEPTTMMTRNCAMFVMLKEGCEIRKNYTPTKTTYMYYTVSYISSLKPYYN